MAKDGGSGDEIQTYVRSFWKEALMAPGSGLDIKDEPVEGTALISMRQERFRGSKWPSVD